MDSVSYILAIVVGYLLGSTPVGYLLAKAHGVDIFKAGSGNPGATNVKRVLGRKAGNTVFFLDALKGALAAGWPMLMAYLSTRFYSSPGSAQSTNTVQYVRDLWNAAQMLGLVSLCAAVVGHSFSIYTKFRGGKGVATTAGGLVVLMPISCAVGAVVWLIAFYSTRFVSVGSILAALAVPLASWIGGNPLPVSLVATAVGLFVVFRHRENIKRLLNGTENKFVKKPVAQPNGAAGGR